MKCDFIFFGNYIFGQKLCEHTEDVSHTVESTIVHFVGCTYCCVIDIDFLGFVFEYQTPNLVYIKLTLVFLLGKDGMFTTFFCFLFCLYLNDFFHLYCGLF